MGPGRGVAAAALAIIVAITAAWWTLALYPAGVEAPSWVMRTRAACFGSVGSGLPTAGGWVLLVGEPIGMIGTLVAIWGESLVHDLAWLSARTWGRATLALAALLLLVGIALASARVATRLGWGGEGAFDPRASARPVALLDVPAPALVLTDQTGERFDLAAWRGGSMIVTFAFAHCADVCPTLVHDVLAAREQAGRRDLSIVVVTLDPWRDTPARLPHIVKQWRLTPGDRLLGGSVEEVNATLDAWSVGRARNSTTGEISHAAVAYLVRRDGRVVARVDGAMERMRELLRTSATESGTLTP